MRENQDIYGIPMDKQVLMANEKIPTEGNTNKKILDCLNGCRNICVTKKPESKQATECSIQ